LLAVAEDTLRDNFIKAQKTLGIRHRSLYQAKHTYAVLSLLAGESPAVVAQPRHLARHPGEALSGGRLFDGADIPEIRGEPAVVVCHRALALLCRAAEPLVEAP
jgi:hypothetical protein